MIILIHGENELEKNAYITSLKERGKQEVVSLNVQNTDTGDLIQAVSTTPVFFPKRLVIFERFFTKKNPFDFGFVHPQVDLVILERGKLAEYQIKKLPSLVKVLLLKEEPAIFRFLDSLYPKNTKDAMIWLQKVRQKKDPQLLFWLITQYIRRLLLAKEGALESLKDGEKLRDWQIQKYQSKAKRFSRFHLEKIYKKIFSLEFAQKFGGADLEESLPLLIFELTKPSETRYT